MTPYRLARLPETAVDPVDTLPPGWAVIEGSPGTQTWRHYRCADASMVGGVWEATVGTFDVSYSSWEFCHILEGRCVITPAGGPPFHVQAGDSFIVEPGFKGIWQVVERVRKHYIFRLDNFDC